MTLTPEQQKIARQWCADQNNALVDVEWAEVEKLILAILNAQKEGEELRELCIMPGCKNNRHICQYHYDKMIDRLESPPPRVSDDGEIWSAIRTLLSQGGDIQMDYQAGKYKSYEEYAARLDGAARERIEWLRDRMEGK